MAAATRRLMAALILPTSSIASARVLTQSSLLSYPSVRVVTSSRAASYYRRCWARSST